MGECLWVCWKKITFRIGNNIYYLNIPYKGCPREGIPPPLPPYLDMMSAHTKGVMAPAILATLHVLMSLH